MAGFSNDVMYANNVNFAGGKTATVISDGQLLIGSTASPNIRVGTLSSADGSIQITNGPGTINLKGITSSQDLHITPFIVSPSGFVNGANYITIQSALDAANAAGGGMIWVQPGTYTENLTLYTNTQVIGAVGFSDFGGGVVISGVHTPPTTGNFLFRNVRLVSATHVFSSVAAGSSTIVVADAAVVVTSGYLFNLPNWTGGFQVWDVYSGDGANDGFVNNTGGAVVVGFEAGVGVGTTQTMTISGVTLMEGCQIDAPSNFVTGASFTFDECQFTKAVTCSNNSTGAFNTSRISSGAAAALTMSSSGAVSINTSILTSSNNPCIAGAGAGVLTLSAVTFTSNTAIAGTVVLASKGTFARTPIYRDEGSSTSVKINSGSFATSGITLTTPVSTNLSDGDVLEFVATNGVLVVQLAATQVGHVGSLNTSAAGTITSTSTGDALILRYQASTNDWWATSVIGTWLIA